MMPIGQIMYLILQNENHLDFKINSLNFVFPIFIIRSIRGSNHKINMFSNNTRTISIKNTLVRVPVNCLMVAGVKDMSL